MNMLGIFLYIYQVGWKMVVVDYGQPVNLLVKHVLFLLKDLAIIAISSLPPGWSLPRDRHIYEFDFYSDFILIKSELYFRW